MNYYGTFFWAPTDSLSHYGIKGMKWGVRRWQNSDGSFNSAGKQRYFGDGSGENYKQKYKTAKKEYNKAFNKYYYKSHQAFSLSKKKREANQERFNEALAKAHNLNVAKQEYKTSKALEKSKKFNDSINSARKKNDTRLENKYNKKVESGKMTKEEASRRLDDFRQGTKMVETGQKKYDAVIKNYGDVRLKSLNDYSYRKTDEYKKAKKEYMNQKVSDLLYSQAYTKLKYATESNKD